MRRDKLPELVVLSLLGVAIFSCRKGDGPPAPSAPPADSSAVYADDLPAADNSIPAAVITWDTGARKISHEVGYAEYGRVHRINGDTLLLTYHCGPYKATFFGVDIALRRSVDGGLTWSAPDILADGPAPGYYGFQNPEILVLRNGWILLAFVGRGKPDNNADDNVQVRISKDRGYSWGTAAIVTRGRSWEPGLLQLPDGTIDLFYSSEAAWFPGTDVQQEILLITSSDNGLTWTAPRRASYSPGNRDGMAVPVLLAGGRGIAFAIESVGNARSPWIIWSSVKANYAYAGYGTEANGRRWQATSLTGFGGAPYLIVLPDGETVLSMQSSAGRNTGGNWKKSVPSVFTGNAAAGHFMDESHPWTGLAADQGAYFNSLFLDNDSTVVLISSRNFPDGHSEVWWKQGHIRE